MASTEILLAVVHGLLLVPVAGGSVFSILCVWAAFRVIRGGRRRLPAFTPPVSVLKPVYGIDRGLEDNLRSFCAQDYPDYQLVLSLQRADDPALPILERIARDHPDRVSLVVEDSEPVLNGKVQNLLIGLTAARHDILVISDSDTGAPPGYLRTIVAPLADPAIGYVCTLYRMVGPRNLAERLELLTMNADFVPSLLFTWWSKAAVFCLGASIAVRRADLEAVGGMASLADYLVEDQEMGRRLVAKGKAMHLEPMTVDMLPDHADLKDWWRHLVYWDQNTKAASPAGFTATVLVRAVPFALAFAAATGFSATGAGVLAATLAIRLGGAAAIAGMMSDRAVLTTLWLLPVRDVVGFASWVCALRKRSFVWRGHEFGLTREGRIIPRSR